MFKSSYFFFLTMRNLVDPLYQVFVLPPTHFDIHSYYLTVLVLFFPTIWVYSWSHYGMLICIISFFFFTLLFDDMWEFWPSMISHWMFLLFFTLPDYECGGWPVGNFPDTFFPLRKYSYISYFPKPHLVLVDLGALCWVPQIKFH